ncbi:fasciclin domain-containing protein [Hymenobacter weizhouensis]|uniref:fasciclin domain-containing protein n=1 Tax=Hymenobacter sp. YIM 151500-1 TaxID=2987689 RepID=UPI002226E0D2|nr:fasciclin domain-containing protein [Hymenobacter sp. YIM 151500-1]UYZ63508.1 fasciclin domain-containing protein [Hymenobacter sp. YIM 151500-1]
MPLSHPWPMLRVLALWVCAALGLSLTACDDDEATTPPASSQNIVQVAQGNASFSVLVAAVTKADLGTTLSGTGPFTVFAPTNDAFAKLQPPFNTAANITAITDANQIATLRSILLYHVVGANIKAADIPAGASSRTTARPASSGVNDNTIYLTKSGANVFINGRTRVVTADVAASNGTIHAIDNVLMPPSQTIAQLVTSAASRATNPEFTLLLQALQRPAAAPILAAAGNAGVNVTVFAPTDAAFRALLGNNSLSSVSDADLTAILSRHVISTGRVFSSDLAAGTVATLGGNVTIGTTTSGGFTVRGGSGTAANIGNTAATVDILATNGVVHVIDQVIRP